MRYGIVAAVIAALLVGGAMTSHQASAESPASDSQPGRQWRQIECRFAMLDGHPGWSLREVARTIACATSRWAVPGGLPKALDVARCESGLRARASNGGRYLGVYQHAAAYWPSRVRTLNPSHWSKPLSPSAFSARSNVVVAIRMAHAGGWSPWSCA